MADEEELKPEDEIKPGNIDIEARKVTFPKREVEDDEDDGHRSLDEAEHATPNLTDLQAAIKKLLPVFSDKEIDDIAQVMMIGRLAPEVKMPLLRLTVRSLLKRHDPREHINVAKTVAQIDSITSIGLEGEGRIDVIKLTGAAEENKEFDKLGQSLGIGR